MTTTTTTPNVAPDLADPIYTTRHLARLFGCSVRTVRTDYIRRPGFPAPLGLSRRDYQWNPEEVNGWWRSQRGQLRPSRMTPVVSHKVAMSGIVATKPLARRRQVAA